MSANLFMEVAGVMSVYLLIVSGLVIGHLMALEVQCHPATS